MAALLAGCQEAFQDRPSSRRGTANTKPKTNSATGNLGPIGFAASRSVGQSLAAFGDVFVQPTLRWNHGVHNVMDYGMTNLPETLAENAVLIGTSLRLHVPANREFCREFCRVRPFLRF